MMVRLVVVSDGDGGVGRLRWWRWRGGDGVRRGGGRRVAGMWPERRRRLEKREMEARYLPLKGIPSRDSILVKHKDFTKSELMVLASKTGLEFSYQRAQEEARNSSKRKDGIQFNVDKFENASKSLNKLIECQIVDHCKKGLGYNAVPPPYTGNFMPPTPDLSFTGLDEFVNKPVVENRKSDEEVSKVVKKSDDSLIIED
ncbi:hypothetical protein Tco_0889379 [Tanacetum coccineum]